MQLMIIKQQIAALTKLLQSPNKSLVITKTTVVHADKIYEKIFPILQTAFGKFALNAQLNISR